MRNDGTTINGSDGNINNVTNLFTSLKRLSFTPQKAFTLAEVLVTLGIIGIVAAMTLPTLINNSRNKQLEAALHKNYSIIQQALEMYQAEHGVPLTPDITGTQTAANSLTALIKPYFAVLYDCGLSRVTKCMPLPAGEENNGISRIYKTYNNKTLNLNLLDDGQFVLKDGSLILIENPGSSQDRLRLITVDVNGINKKPNKWGHDLFTFQLMDDGRLLPSGAEGTKYKEENTYCSINATNHINGVGCTYKALTEKDYFKNLPK